MISIKDIKKSVLALLGNNDINVELEEDDWDVILLNSIKCYSKYRPKMINVEKTLVKNQYKYQLEPKDIGRGVFDIMFPATTNVNSNVNLYENPFMLQNVILQGTNSYGASQYTAKGNVLQLSRNIVTETRKSINGTKENWRFNIDTKELDILPHDLTGTMIVQTLHDRILYKKKYKLDTSVTYPKIINLYDKFDDLTNITPDSIHIYVDNTPRCKESNGNILDIISDTIVGTIDRRNGILTLSSAISNTTYELEIEINEVRTSDYTWFQQYAYSQACIIVGNKRNRFGSIPGIQSNITLDTQKLQEGIDSRTKLEEDATSWGWEWAIARLE